MIKMVLITILIRFIFNMYPYNKSLINMKSKRKQINKYTTRHEDHPICNGIFLRTAGNKPFQLRQLRLTKHSCKTFKLNHHIAYDMHDPPYGISTQHVDLNLIINKKTLINGKHNQKLKSQRRNIVFNYQRQTDQEIDEGKEGDIYNQEKYLEDKPFTVLGQYNSEQMNESPTLEDKLKEFSHDPQFPVIADKVIAYGQKGTNNELCGVINENQNVKVQNHINQYKNQYDLKSAIRQPFAFKNQKWRSKSQIFRVDKWKQKYGGSEFNRPSGHVIDNSRKGLLAIMSKKFSQKNSEMSRKMNFMEKEYSQKLAYATMPSKEVVSVQPIKKLELQKRQEKLQSIHNHEKDMLLEGKNSIKLQRQIRKQSDRDLEQVSPMTIKIKQIVIDTPKITVLDNPETIIKIVDDNAQISQEQTLQQGQKQFRVTKKKWSFPSIQISSFNSTRDVEDERWKTTKIFNVQKLQRDWKQKPPKQVFLEKMLEQIPQRWEHLQSRDISRQEVGTYIHFKKQQELQEQIMRQMEERRLAQIRKQQEELFGNLDSVET